LLAKISNKMITAAFVKERFECANMALHVAVHTGILPCRRDSSSI
jgi:hypothetical protein